MRTAAPYSLPLFSLLLLSTTLILRASAQVQLFTSLSSQYPPVARVGQSFSWSFYEETFYSSDNSSLSYNAEGLPEWCSLDSPSRTLAGIPSDEDVFSSWVTITANSSDGSSASDGFNLLVIHEPAPSVNLSIEDQLPTALTLGSDYVNAFDGDLRIPPGWSFSIGLQPYTFQSNNPNTNAYDLYYAAHMSDFSALPGWLRFDNETLTLSSDAAPVNTADADEAFNIVITCSDQFGYSDVNEQFTLAVSQYSFDIVHPFPAINATVRTAVNYTLPLENIELDNHTATSADLNVTANLTEVPFLKFDENELRFTGQLPDFLPATINIHFPIILTSIHGTALADNLTLNVIPSIFTNGTLPPLEVVKNEEFYYDLSKYAADNNATYDADISPPEAKSWLSFDQNNMTLSGVGPSNKPDYQDVNVDFYAHDNDTGVQDQASLVVTYTEQQLQNGSSSDNHRTLKIVLGTVLGALALLLLLFLGWKLYQGYTGGGRKKDRGISSSQIRKVRDDSSSITSAASTAYEKDFFAEWDSKDEKYVEDENLDQPRQHNIVLVTDGQGRTTEADYDDGNDGVPKSRTNGTTHSFSSQYQSTWGSKASSSLFYSDVESGFDSPGTPGSDSSGKRDGLTPPRSKSIPRQRADFRPFSKTSEPSPENGVPPIPSVEIGTAHSSDPPTPTDVNFVYPAENVQARDSQQPSMRMVL